MIGLFNEMHQVLHIDWVRLTHANWIVHDSLTNPPSLILPPKGDTGRMGPGTSPKTSSSDIKS